MHIQKSDAHEYTSRLQKLCIARSAHNTAPIKSLKAHSKRINILSCYDILITKARINYFFLNFFAKVIAFSLFFVVKFLYHMGNCNFFKMQVRRFLVSGFYSLVMDLLILKIIFANTYSDYSYCLLVKGVVLCNLIFSTPTLVLN